MNFYKLLFTNFSSLACVNIINLSHPNDFPFENPSLVDSPKFWMDRLFHKVRFFIPMPKQVRIESVKPGTLCFGNVSDEHLLKKVKKNKKAKGVLEI